MTDAQLARIEALVNEGPLPYTEAALLVEEAKRLRGLIASARDRDGECTFCGQFAFELRDREPHKSSCPAFNPDGGLK